MCSRSEQSTANDATFPKMDTHCQSSRAIPLSHKRGGRHVGDTCLDGGLVCNRAALMPYTVQPVLTKRSAQWRKAFWALPAVDLHATQVLQGLIASRKLPLQLCAAQVCPSHWLTRAMCSRSEQSIANDATFPKMDTHWQSSRAIPISQKHGGRIISNTSLENQSAVYSLIKRR